MINKKNEILKFETVKNQINDVYVVSFLLIFPTALCAKCNTIWRGFHARNEDLFPMSLCCAISFFSKPKHTMFKCYESERYNSISNTNPAFFLNAQIL